MDQSTKQQTATAAAAPPRQGASNADPTEAARRELVAWCERHGLPVPAERRDPRR